VLKCRKVGQINISEHFWEPGIHRNRGLGFSLRAAPLWIADALFQIVMSKD